MAISYISSAAANANTVTMPSHQSGDLIVALAFRDGSTTLPGIPGDWTALDTNTANSASCRTGYKIADSGSEATGTWTDATNIIVQVYRGDTLSVGAHVLATGTPTTVTYPGLTMVDGGGTAWVVCITGNRQGNTASETPPAGTTFRNGATQASNEVDGFDTNGGVSSWSSVGVDVGGTAQAWVATSIEIDNTVGAQNIDGALYTDGDTFHAATIGRGAVNIAGALYSDPDTFFGAVITYDQAITGALYTDTDSFFGATVAASNTIAGGLFTDGDTVFGAALTATYNITGGLYADSDIFFNATISGGASIPIVTTAKRAAWRRRRR